MSTEITATAARLQSEVPVAEDRVDAAIIALSTLMATVVTARRNIPGIPPAKGHATIHRLAKAQLSLVDVSADVLRLHGDLVDIGKETAGYDLHEECPKRKATLGPLHAVG
jgi:hypothetical protein